MEKADINVFSIHTICIWVVAFFMMEFAMRHVYLNVVGGENFTAFSQKAVPQNRPKRRF